MNESIEYLRQSRPTAVNLFNDTEKIYEILKEENFSNFKFLFETLVDQQYTDYQEAYLKMSQFAGDSILEKL